MGVVVRAQFEGLHHCPTLRPLTRNGAQGKVVRHRARMATVDGMELSDDDDVDLMGALTTMMEEADEAECAEQLDGADVSVVGVKRTFAEAIEEGEAAERRAGGGFSDRLTRARKRLRHHRAKLKEKRATSFTSNDPPEERYRKRSAGSSGGKKGAARMKAVGKRARPRSAPSTTSTRNTKASGSARKEKYSGIVIR